MVTSRAPAHLSPARRRDRLASRSMAAARLLHGVKRGQIRMSPLPTPLPQDRGPTGLSKPSDRPRTPRCAPAPSPRGEQRRCGGGTCGGAALSCPAPHKGWDCSVGTVICGAICRAARHSPSEPRQLLPRPYLTRRIIPGAATPRPPFERVALPGRLRASAL